MQDIVHSLTTINIQAKYISNIQGHTRTAAYQYANLFLFAGILFAVPLLVTKYYCERIISRVDLQGFSQKNTRVSKILFK